MNNVPWQVQSEIAKMRQQEFRAEAQKRRRWREARQATREHRRAHREAMRVERAAARAQRDSKAITATPPGAKAHPETT